VYPWALPIEEATAASVSRYDVSNRGNKGPKSFLVRYETLSSLESAMYGRATRKSLFSAREGGGGLRHGVQT